MINLNLKIRMNEIIKHSTTADGTRNLALLRITISVGNNILGSASFLPFLAYLVERGLEI